MTSVRPAPHQWRGVIEEYRELLDIPAGVPAITLREGGTPLVPSSIVGSLPGPPSLWLSSPGMSSAPDVPSSPTEIAELS